MAAPKHPNPTKVEYFLWALILVATAYAVVATAQDRTSQLDLPMSPARFGEAAPSWTPKPDPVEADDPRDTPPPTIYGEDIDSESQSVVYVIDRSGSMADRSRYVPGRLTKAKAQLRESIASLPENWRFGALSFGGMLGPWDGLRDATSTNKAAAMAWVESLEAGGGTPTGEAMAVAMQSNPECLLFLLLSDGSPNNGPDNARAMIRANNYQGATINTYGISASGNFRAFLQGVASDSGGTYTDVP